MGDNEPQTTPVRACRVEECAHNREMVCYAKAITIGDDEYPKCATFFHFKRHSAAQAMAEVGACNVVACRFNEDFRCAADRIEVDRGADMADCMSFSRR